MVRPFFVWRDVTAREKKDGNTEFTEIGTQRAQRTARGRGNKRGKKGEKKREKREEKRKE
jgi:hypothetical protein